MVRYLIVFLIAASFVMSCASGIAQETQPPMTNADVVKMIQSGRLEADVISAIKAAPPNFDITNEAILALRQQKVPENVLLAMIRRQVLENNSRRKAKAASHRAAPTGPWLKWQVEVHGGLSRSHQMGGWQLPPSAVAYSLYGTGFQGDSSIHVSSYYFGNGAQLIGTAALDPILTKSVVEPQGKLYGFRASRDITRRFAVEFTFDRTDKVGLTNQALTTIQNVTTQFSNVFARLNVPGNAQTSSVSTVSPNAGHQAFATAAVVFNLPKIFKVNPYVTAGGGVFFGGGGSPSVTIAGSYGGPTALETDTVNLSFAQSGSRALTEVVGFGFKAYLTQHLGFRADIRGYLYHDPFNTVMDATHTNTPNAAWVVKASGSTSVPFIQLLTGPGMSAYSTLSGPQISGLKTFFGTGNQRQIPLTVGLFWRF